MWISRAKSPGSGHHPKWAGWDVLCSAFELSYSRIPSSFKFFSCYFYPFIPPPSLTLLPFSLPSLSHLLFIIIITGIYLRGREKRKVQERKRESPELPLKLDSILIFELTFFLKNFTSLPLDSSQALSSFTPSRSRIRSYWFQTHKLSDFPFPLS